MKHKTVKPLRFANEPQTILLILPTWVGDLVMATPFIESLFARFPQAKVSFVLNRHLTSLLEASPWVGQHYYWPKKDKSPEAKQAQKALVSQLREQKFDLAITLPNSFRSAWLCWQAGAKRRVGFNRDGRGLLLTDRIPVPNRASSSERQASITKGRFNPLPLVEYYSVLAQALDCPKSGDNLQLFTTPAEDQAVMTRLKAEGFSQAQPHAQHQPLVVVCPGANFGASKCWPPERFAKVADELAKQHNAFIAISPGPGEEPLAQAIADTMQYSSALLVAPCLSLGELKSLIARSDLLLGNDTGPRHFGRAFDVHRVTVFGPTEERWTDTSHGRESIVRVQVPCGPCHKKVCPLERQDCMEDVTVAMVAAASHEQLTQALAAKGSRGNSPG